MTGGTWPQASLCLFSGALLGLLFLACKLLRVLLGLGRLATALLDLAFCLFCGLTAFLCALVLDQGRLRLFQTALQLLGAWGAAAALDPLVEGAARLLRRTAARMRRALGRPLRFLREKWAKTFPKQPRKPVKRKKPGGNGKKPKNHLKILHKLRYNGNTTSRRREGGRPPCRKPRVQK